MRDGIARATTYVASVAPPTLMPGLPHTRSTLAKNATRNVASRTGAICPLTTVASAAAMALVPISTAIVHARALYDPPLSDRAPLNPPRLIHVAAP